MGQSIARLAITMRLKITLVLAFALFLLNDREVLAQDAEGSGSGDVAEEGGSGAETDAAEGSGAAAVDEGSGAEGSGDEECEGGSGDDIASLLAPDKCKNKGAEMSGADALAEALGGGSCDTSGMDESLAGCLEDLGTRVNTLEQALLSGEGGQLEDQITLVLVKKGIIDCENNTQCDDDKACLDSYKEPGRMLCEPVCERLECPVDHSECVAFDHIASCECKEGFHGNGTDSCVPDGFTEEANGKHYRMFDDKYVEWDEAHTHCDEMGARLPVLDSKETIDIIKKYLDESNFTVFEQWDRSSRRVWLGLIYDRGSGLYWADGQKIISYPASSRLFVWEARRLLSQEVARADSSRHYGFYIDGDIAKLPGGGRRGAAILCELLPEGSGSGNSNPSYNDGGYPDYYRRGQQRSRR